MKWLKRRGQVTPEMHYLHCPYCDAEMRPNNGVFPVYVSYTLIEDFTAAVRADSPDVTTWEEIDGTEE